MVEIKCKAWDKKSNKMCKVDSIAFDDEGNIKVVNCWGKDIIEQKRIIVHREPPNVIVLWWTGLKDNNGKEIYEGDIAEIEFGKKAEIKYIKNGGGFFLEIHHKVSKEQIQLTKSWADDIKIIGNKYENPELINNA